MNFSNLESVRRKRWHRRSSWGRKQHWTPQLSTRSLLSIYKHNITCMEIMVWLYWSNEAKQRRKNTPERISNAVREVNKVIFVDREQVARVEVSVTLLKDVSHDFTRSQLFLASVSIELRVRLDFAHKQTRFACWKYDTESLRLNDLCSV